MHPACVLCGAKCGSLDQCATFRNSTVTERRGFVTERKMCRKCLANHGGRCSRTRPCGIDGCSVQHHELLHTEHRPTATSTSHDPCTGGTGNTSEPDMANILLHTGSNEGTLLKYVPITLYGPAARVDTFALLDDGSTSTLIDEGLMQELGVTGAPHPLNLQWTV